MSAPRCAHCGHLHKSEGQGVAAVVHPRCHVFSCECSNYWSRAKVPSRLQGPINRTRRLYDDRTTTQKRGGSLMGVTRATGP